MLIRFEHIKRWKCFGQGELALIEENLTWVAQWDADENGSKPTLTSLVVDQYESAERVGNEMFSDCTNSIIGHSEQFKKQLLQGYNHWLEQSQFQEFYALQSNPGVSIGDLNNDGLEDLFICQEVGLPNLIYLQNEDGSLSDFSKQSNLDLIQNCRSALIVDWNNDGKNDVAIAVTGGIVIASGNGTGRFNVETIIDSNEDVLVLSAADYDLDGRLDLFAGVYFANFADGQKNDLPIGAQGGAIDSNTGGKNGLYRNEIDSGTWTFSDVTTESGMDAKNARYSQAAGWEDFDNDGDPDLYVANDFGLNNLYRNDLQSDGSRKFVEISNETGVEDQAAGMSVAWGDYDRDGWMDLYVGNMYSYAGNRITFQSNFKPEGTNDVKQRFQRFARGNTFFRNKGADGDSFEDLSVELDVNRGRWAWGSRFMDLNNDGWEDLVVANGYITTDDSGDL